MGAITYVMMKKTFLADDQPWRRRRSLAVAAAAADQSRGSILWQLKKGGTNLQHNLWRPDQKKSVEKHKPKTQLLNIGENPQVTKQTWSDTTQDSRICSTMHMMSADLTSLFDDSSLDLKNLSGMIWKPLLWLDLKNLSGIIWKTLLDMIWKNLSGMIRKTFLDLIWKMFLA